MPEQDKEAEAEELEAKPVDPLLAWPNAERRKAKSSDRRAKAWPDTERRIEDRRAAPKPEPEPEPELEPQPEQPESIFDYLRKGVYHG